MRRATAMLVMLSTVACDPRTDAERGAELFRPAAEKLGAAMAADLKEKARPAYEKYLADTTSKDEAELGRLFAKDYLSHYAAALALPKDEEKELRAGRFKDVENRKKMNELLNRYVASSTTLIGRLIVAKTQAGAEWNSGLQLELAMRILKAELDGPK